MAKIQMYTRGVAYAKGFVGALSSLFDVTLTATASELNQIHSVSPGTTSASKVLVVDANKRLDTLVIGASGLKIGAGAGTAMTATAAELNANAGVTAGAASASKTVVLDATKSVAGLTFPVAIVTADTTLTAADSNKLVIINAAATKTMTLPAANAVAAGMSYTFSHQVASSSGAGHTIHPVGTDLMRGNGFTPSAGKGAVCTQATARIGDSITIVSDGVSAWYITQVIGTWAREA